MPTPARPLTDKVIRDAIAGRGTRRFPLYDGHGLHLIERGGHHHWRLKYRRPDGRENRLALGGYPEVSLAEARTIALAARAKLRQGADPGGERAAAKAAARAVAHTFADVARDWLSLKSSGWSRESIKKNRRAVEVYLLPSIGRLDIGSIRTADVLPAIQSANVHSPEFARASAQAARNIVRLAIAKGLREEGHLLDLDLRHNLPRRQRGHMPAATTPAALGEVLDVIRALPSPETRGALLMCCYVGQRPGNVVAMAWNQIDLREAEWVLPAVEMKTGHDHIVPLPKQAVAILKDLRPLTGGRGYVFPPAAQQKNEHLTRDTLSKALRDAGLRGKQTPHGLRATLRTVARERLGVHADVLEAQIAHAKHGEVQAAYDRTGFVKERHAVMQQWADYIDGLGESAPQKQKKRRSI